MPEYGLSDTARNAIDSLLIDLDPLSQDALGNDARLYEVPSEQKVRNAEWGTKPLPVWRICWNTGRHRRNGDRGGPILYRGGRVQGCPVCKSSAPGDSEPVRFVMACTAGHLDDVAWPRLVHGQRRSCDHRDWFWWEGAGSTISSLRVVCPMCSATLHMGEAYSKKDGFRCSGRTPQFEGLSDPPSRSECDHPARIVQRGASNLRVVGVEVLLTLSSYSELQLILARPDIRPRVESLVRQLESGKSEDEELDNFFKYGVPSGSIDDASRGALLSASRDELMAAARSVARWSPLEAHERYRRELEILTRGSEEGVPPVSERVAKRVSRIVFSMDPTRKTSFRVGGFGFDVTPVPRLRTVVVQRWFSRLVGDEKDVNKAARVDVGWLRNDKRLYPATSFLGEGLFVRVTEGPQGPFGDSWRSWGIAIEHEGYTDWLFRDPKVREELDPVFVWWHTFSHALIRALALDAGYSAASIRERVYGGRSIPEGGLLLYATQPGSDGTLGGLVALVDRFEAVAKRALYGLMTCSNDPLCLEKSFRPGAFAGAACYGCTILSETSCEHRNIWLDRRVVLETLQDG